MSETPLTFNWHSSGSWVTFHWQSIGIPVAVEWHSIGSQLTFQWHPLAVNWHSIVFQVTFEWPRISINRLIISAPSDTSLTFNYQGLEIKIFWVGFSCQWKCKFSVTQEWRLHWHSGTAMTGWLSLPLEPMHSFWPILCHSGIWSVIQNDSSGSLTFQKSWPLYLI